MSGVQSLERKLAGANISQSVFSDVKSAVKESVPALLSVAEALPIAGPFAKILRIAINVCNNYKCNKKSFEQLKARLYRFAEFSFGKEGILRIAEQRQNNAVMKPFVDHMIAVLEEGIQEIGSFARAGFLKTLLTGTKMKRTFNELDGELSRSLNELSAALQVTQLNEQCQTYDVICDIQSKIDLLGGFQAVHDNPAVLERLADEIGANVTDLRDELMESLNRIEEVVVDIHSTMVSQNKATASALGNLQSTATKTSQKLDGLDTTLIQIQDVLQNQAKSVNVETLYVVDKKDSEDSDDDSHILGRGAFGVTQKMRNIVDNGTYAVKVIRVKDAAKNGIDRDDLLREASFLQQLNHPYIVRYFTCFFSKGDKNFNVVMELVTGGTMVDKIVDANVGFSDVLKWWTQIASVLYYMHYEIRIQHRDIKPENILLTSYGSIKIIDLGMASIVRSSASKMSKVGTTTYNSYEKANDIPYDGRDDVWAAGCMIAELMTKSRLTDRGGAIYMYTNTAVSERRLKLIADCKEVDAHYGAVLERMLEPQQENRCNSQDLVEMLNSNSGLIIPKVDGASERIVDKFVSKGLRDTKEWKAFGILENCNGKFGCINSCINSEGTKIATYSVNNSYVIKLWDVSTCQLTATFRMIDRRFRVGGFISGDRLVIVTRDCIGILNAEFNHLEEVIDYSNIGYKTMTSFNVTDGDRAVSCHGCVKVWDLVENKLLSVVDVNGEVTSAHIDRKGNNLATGSAKGLVKCWNALDGTLIRNFFGHDKKVTFVKLSNSVTRIVSGSDDKTVIIWSINTGSALFKLADHTEVIISLAWSSDDSVVLTCSQDRAILSNTANGTVVTSLDGLGTNVISACISGDDSKIVATVGDDVRIWTSGNDCVKVGSNEFSITAPTLEVSQTAPMAMSRTGVTLRDKKDWKLFKRYLVDNCDDFNAESTVFVSRNYSGIRFCDTMSGQVITHYAVENPVRLGSFLPNDKFLIVTKDFIGAINVKNNYIEQLIRDPHQIDFESILEVESTADGTTAFLLFKNEIKVWDLVTKRLMIRIDEDNKTFNALSVDAAGSTVLCGVHDTQQRYDVNRLKAWNVRDGSWKWSWAFHDDRIAAYKMSHDGTRVVSAYESARNVGLRVHQFNSDKTQFIEHCHKQRIDYICWSRDDSIFMSSSMDKTINIFNSATHCVIKSLSHSDMAGRMNMSPDGSKIFAKVGGFRDIYVYVWSSANVVSELKAVQSKPPPSTVNPVRVASTASSSGVASAQVMTPKASTPTVSTVTTAPELKVQVQAPAARSPTTVSPVASAVKTLAPIVSAPPASEPAVLVPVTPAPVSPAPVTPAPVAPATPVVAAPIAPAPVAPAPIAPAPVVPAPIAPAPIAPAPVVPAPVVPAPVAPAPIAPAPVAPAPVAPASVSPASLLLAPMVQAPILIDEIPPAPVDTLLKSSNLPCPPRPFESVSLNHSPNSQRVRGNLLTKNDWRVGAQIQKCHGEQFCYVHVNPQRTAMVTSSKQDTSIILWDLSSFQRIAMYRMPDLDFVISGFISKNRIIIGTPSYIGFLSPDFKTLEKISFGLFFGKREFQLMRTIGGTSRALKAYSYHTDGAIRLWDLNGGLIAKISDSRSNGDSLDMDGDGRWLVSSSTDGSITIWNGATGSRIRILKGHTGSVDAVKFNADASKVLSGSFDNTIIIWSVSSGIILYQLTGHTAFVTNVCWSADGSVVLSASADKTIKVWNSSAGSLIQTLEGHSNGVHSVSISSDGTQIVSNSYDKSVAVWL